ncbi:hypothetical protein C0J29_13800 [Mycobacterium paragordonae]|uniref:XRE family transcriptional regulator n=1 Tax=Mycobacterium paragordonae TaxID=1389713 RepID=A0ABQ1C3F6_9MYCO|nr:hypothetical protein [Mycobacterium paragordonae]AYE95718.1 hypothetical protein C0J29_13800 [Mycobacterium paragordonae]GFG78988.1 hypothetical protein MPRG_22640 [Mycobacterium paragordonae]
MTRTDEPPTIAAVVGAACRSLRGERRTAEVARAAQLAGLTRWTTGRVAELERGAVTPTLATLYGLTQAFSDLLERPVTLTELLPGDGPVSLGHEHVAELASIRAALSGEPIQPRQPEALSASEAVRRSFLDVDYRVAAELELDPDQAAEVMAGLWGRSFTDERDRRAGPGVTKQKRARVGMQAKAELREAVSDGEN